MVKSFRFLIFKDYTFFLFCSLNLIKEVVFDSLNLAEPGLFLDSVPCGRVTMSSTFDIFLVKVVMAAYYQDGYLCYGVNSGSAETLSRGC